MIQYFFHVELRTNSGQVFSFFLFFASIQTGAKKWTSTYPARALKQVNAFVKLNGIYFRIHPCCRWIKFMRTALGHYSLNPGSCKNTWCTWQIYLYCESSVEKAPPHVQLLCALNVHRTLMNITSNIYKLVSVVGTFSPLQLTLNFRVVNDLNEGEATKTASHTLKISPKMWLKVKYCRRLTGELSHFCLRELHVWPVYFSHTHTVVNPF